MYGTRYFTYKHVNESLLYRRILEINEEEIVLNGTRRDKAHRINNEQKIIDRRKHKFREMIYKINLTVG
jgi:hypothetical protein